MTPLLFFLFCESGLFLAYAERLDHVMTFLPLGANVAQFQVVLLLHTVIYDNWLGGSIS